MSKSTKGAAAPGKAEGDNEPALPGIGGPPQTLGTDEPAAEFLPGFKTREEAVSFVTDARSKLDGLTDFQRQAQEREQRLQDQIDRLLGSVGQPKPAAAQPESLETRIAALPDPVEKPEEFRRGLATVIAETRSGAVREMESANSQQQAIAGAYSDFQRDYPDLAKYNRVVESVAREEMERIRKRGGDPLQQLVSDPDRFNERVARLARAELDSMGVKFGEAEEGDDPPAPRKNAPNRTAGTSGGSPPARGNGAPPQGGTWVKDLQARQRKLGLI